MCGPYWSQWDYDDLKDWMGYEEKEEYEEYSGEYDEDVDTNKPLQ